MSVSIYAVTVEVFVPLLGNLAGLLRKAKSFAETRKLDPGVIEALRLTPDMFPLRRQVQLTTDFAKNSTARLAGIDAPKFADDEQTLDELLGRIERTIEWLKGVTPQQLEGAETRRIVVPLRARTLEIEGLPFIQKWALPNFHFHLTTTYALLRQAGVEVGKWDYLGGV